MIASSVDSLCLSLMVSQLGPFGMTIPDPAGQAGGRQTATPGRVFGLYRCPGMGYHGNEDYNGNGAVDVAMENCFLWKDVSPAVGSWGRRDRLFHGFWLISAITHFLLKLVCGYISPQNYTSVPLCP